MPADFQKSILDLGEFAFRVLLAQRLCFPESEVNACCDNAMPLGVLMSCEPDPIAGRERQYRFSHLVLQEFFSALFVAFPCHLHPDQISSLVQALGASSGHLSTFWQLLAAHLDSECMNHLCHSLLTNEHTPVPANESDAILFDRAYMPIKVQDSLRSLLSPSVMEVLAAKLLDGLVAVDAVTAVKSEMQCSREDNRNDFFGTLLAV